MGLVDKIKKTLKGDDADNERWGFYQIHEKFIGVLFPVIQGLDVNGLKLNGRYFVLSVDFAEHLRRTDWLIEIKDENSMLPFVFPASLLGLEYGYFYLRDPFLIIEWISLIQEAAFSAVGYITHDMDLVFRHGYSNSQLFHINTSTVELVPVPTYNHAIHLFQSDLAAIVNNYTQQ